MAKYILGYWWLCWEPHKEFCEAIQAGQSPALFLLPRGHCKTLCFTVAHSIQLYLQNPEEPIFIFSYKAAQAEKKLKAIKFHFERNDAFREIFPDLTYPNPRKHSERWTTDEIILPYHTGRQEASVSAYSILAQPTGLHARVIKCDDLVTPENSANREQMDKIREAFGMVRSSILQADGKIAICGTIYDDGDLHREMERSGLYNCYKRPAMDPEKKKILWPVQYNSERLEEIRRDPTVGDYIFSCQYLLDPAPEDENAYFKMAWFPRYVDRPRPLKYYAGIDCAISKREAADYTAIVVAGLDVANELYIVDVRRGHWDALEIIMQILDVQARYRVEIWTGERDIINRVLGPFLSAKMRETGIFCNFELRPVTKDKISRARGIQGRIRDAAVYLPAQGAGAPKWLPDFEHEVWRFPRGQHDDQVDALAWIGIQLDLQSRPWTDEEKEMAVAEDHYNPFDDNAGY